jgi:hypothetical protein
MSTPPNSHKQCFLTQEIDAWVLAVQEQRAKLHIQAAGPWNSNERYEAFAHMSELLLDAFEEMRMRQGDASASECAPSMTYGCVEV